MAMTLTDHLIKTIEPNGTVQEFKDEKVPGLTLRVMPRGKKSWSVRYKPIGSKIAKRYPLGEFPLVSLGKARQKAEEIRGRKFVGADPMAERAALRLARAEEDQKPKLTFNAMADLYLAWLPDQKSSWAQDKGYIDRDARPAFGKRDPATITKAEIAKLLLEKAGTAPVAANRVRAAMLSLFNWSVDNALIAANPMLGIKKPTNEKKRKSKKAIRVLDDAELLVMWRAIEKARLAPGLKACLKVLILTGQRPNEIAGLALAELRDLNKPTALISLPAERMKARRPHVTPLSAPAAEIIRAEIARQRREAEIDGTDMRDHVFASRFLDNERVARHSLSQALRRIIPALDAEGEDGEIVKRLQANRPTPHAFRRTASTGMSRLGIAREDRKAVLAHVEDDVMAEHYDAYERLAEKRVALDKWADHVMALISGDQDTGVVVPIRRAAA